MPDQTITCPFCDEEISLSDTLYKQIKESTRKEFESEARRRDSELKAREVALEETLSKRLAVEKRRLSEAAELKAAERLSLEMKALKQENAEKAKRLEEAEKAELDLRKRGRELEDEKKGMELKAQRVIDAEREKIRADAVNLFSEEHRRKDAEKETKIKDMNRQLDEMQRKLNQGSMQTQGEVLEVELEEMLRESFPIDTIEPVPKGIKGADVLQGVNSSLGQHCGTIAWESKRTKAWNQEWLVKLKDDAREVKAGVAVLVTETLPKDITSFALCDGVWVTLPAFAGALAEVLRSGLIELSHARNSAEGKGEKMEMVYNYLSGPEFKHRVEALVEAFRTMKSDLDKEKSATIKMWSKREKQIERFRMNTAGLYGDMHGLIGATFPEIKALELESGEDSGEEEVGEPLSEDILGG